MKIHALSVKCLDKRVFVLAKQNDFLYLFLLNDDSDKEVARLKGFNGFILDAQMDTALASVDDKLFKIENGRLEQVLKAHRPSNTFWHSIRAGDSLYVQEYGDSPTGLWVSKEDYEDWRLVTTNVQLDRGSRHFHSIAYDPFRKWLIVTLGDGNLLRVVALDYRTNEQHFLYKGPWQFVPIVPLRDRTVFGMDSAISRGGIGIYRPNDESWFFKFFKWSNKHVRLAQMSDLKLLSDGTWLAALGTPQAIVFSKDLETWYLAHVDGFDKQFNPHMSVDESEDFVVCSTGKNFLKFKKDELEDLASKAQPVIVSCRAYIDRLRGYGFILKRKLSGSACYNAFYST